MNMRWPGVQRRVTFRVVARANALQWNGISELAALGSLFAAPRDANLKVDDVSVRDDVRSPLRAVLARGLHLGEALHRRVRCDKVGVRDDLGGDEVLHKVRVDLARGVRRRGALFDRPAPHLLVACGQARVNEGWLEFAAQLTERTRGKEVDEVEVLVRRDDRAGEGRLGAVGCSLESSAPGLVVVQVVPLLLPLDGEGDDGAAPVPSNPLGDGE